MNADNGNISNYRSNSLNKLEKIHEASQEKDPPSGITGFVQTIFSKLNEWRRATPFVVLTKEHNLTLLTQQNTVVKGEGRGSLHSIQKKLFNSMLSKMVQQETPSDQVPSTPSQQLHKEKFEQLHKVIDEMHSNDVDFVRSFFVGNGRIADELYQKYENLKPEESMWMDLSSIKGFHGMKGRIIKNSDDTYTFQMANTGAGIETYSWHKKAENGFVQTVIEWKGMEKIPKEFFRELVNATLDGKVPKNENDSTPFSLTIRKPDAPNHTGDENMKAIDALYATLEKWMPTDHLSTIEFDKKSPYWSLPQEGPSCLPQSIWALLRVSEAPETQKSPKELNSYDELQLNFQLKNLKHLYKKISSGNDRSLYTCQKAYEQAQELILLLENGGKSAPPVLHKIAEDLEVKLSLEIENPNPLIISDNTSEIEVRMADIVSVPGALKAKVIFTPTEGKPIIIKIERTPDGKPTGLSTLAYLLYESLLTNNEEEIEANFIAFLEYTEKSSPKDFEKVDLVSLRALSILFNNLSQDFKKVDGRLVSRAKPLALNNIAQTLFAIYYAEKFEKPLHLDKKDLEVITYAEKSKKRLPLDGKDLEIITYLKSGNSDSLAFLARFGGKLKLVTYFDTNCWYTCDRAVRPFTIKPAWLGNAQRMDVEVKMLEKQPLESVKTIKCKEVDGTDDNPGTPLLPLKPGKIAVTVKTFSYEARNSQIYAVPREIDGKTEITISSTNQGAYDSESLIGKIYLFSAILAQGDRSASAISNLNNLARGILQTTPIQKEDIPVILELTSSLANYCKSVGENAILDKSLESSVYQKSVVNLSYKLLEKCQAVVDSASLKSKISQQMSEIQKEIQYYELLSPQSYVRNGLQF